MALFSFIPADSARFTQKLHETTPQDCTAFLPKEAGQPIVQYDPKQVMDSFLAYYFAPWDNPFQFFSAQVLHEIQQKKVQKYKQKPGWGPNRHPLSQDFIAALGANMYLETFPNYQQPAITVQVGHLRTLPCDKPSFGNWMFAGEGYPFDNWQEILVAPNTPLHVLHTSQDGAWHFVVADYTYGWIQKEALAYVTPAFMTQWRKTKQYITPLHDDVPVKDNMFAPLARVGQLMPLAPTQNNKENYQVLTVAKDTAGYASAQVGSITKTATALMPLLATPSNMARLANNLMGQPYSWGGIGGYRDCSSLLKDLLLPFGIWLPSDSRPQSQAGTLVSLKELNEAEKTALLQAKASPFFSLVYWSGHITLYLGAKQGKVYVYNAIWGLRTEYQGEEGRAVIGKVAIMPIDLGQEYSNVNSSMLSKAQGLIMLNNRLTNPHEKLALHPK